ncbi:MAG: transpeptidase family protein [Bacteroidetes bacterium]|nr:transpeptidase family protein [Bacteroidota bacterium]MBM3424077.1 PASTA domain-containing protein [Bacteroidota bacterium]
MKSNKGPLVFRAYLLYFGFVAIMTLVLYKTLKLQFSNDEVDLPIRFADRAPRMGDVLDANLNPLLTSVSYFDIRMDPTVVDQKIFDAEVSNLAQGLHGLYPNKTSRAYENEIRNARANGGRYLLIRKKVTNDERKKINALPIFNLGRMKGGIIDNEETILRRAPNGVLLRRTLGYYKKELGLEVGIEGAYHAYLEGELGQEIEQKITSGWKKTGRFTKDPVEGADIVTTIDKDIQELAHSELEHQIQEMKAESGTVILMEVRTGHIKAISNLTKEDDGSFSEKFNYSIGLREVPGSTMKLASIMAALEDGKINIKDRVDAIGSYLVIRKRFMDSNDGRGYGNISIQEAFEKSSNIIAWILHKAYRNDPEKFMARLDQFGLTQPLGIELSGELSPKFYRPGQEKWSPYSIPSMAIGYEYQQIPLQTCAFYNAVANNGKFIRPLFVKEIRRAGKVIKSFKPVVIREQICSPATLRIMKSCLEGVMTKGTGKKLTSSQFTIAGKTGTAKLPDKNKQYVEESQSDFQASFVGYFPANKPKYTCLVLITRPKEQKYAALVAGPVFVALANKIYASNLKYHPAINRYKPKKNVLPEVKVGNHNDLIKVFKKLHIPYRFQSNSSWLKTTQKEGKLELAGVKFSENKVPDVRGMTAKDAVFLLESRGLSARVEGAGKVLSQSIAPGSDVYSGLVVKLAMR